jgi:hypothetical protein
MASVSISNTYKRYKAGTAEFTKWLVETARSCGIVDLKTREPLGASASVGQTPSADQKPKKKKKKKKK